MLDLIFNPANYYWNPHAVLYHLVGILTLLEGIFIFSQNRKSLVNLAYGLSCLSVALWLTGTGMALNSKLELTALIWTRTYFFLGVIFNTPSIYFFSVAWQKSLFPQEENKKIKIVIFNFLCGLGFYIFCLNSNLFIQGFWNHSWGFYPKAGSLYFIFVGWVYALMMLMLFNFIQVYRKGGDPVIKKQAKLMIIAFSIGYLGTAEFLMDYGFTLYFLAFIPVFICITIVGYSVIRYRTMDIETVIHKTALWIFSYSLIAAPIFFLYNGLSEKIESSNLLLFIFWTASFLAVTVYLRLIQPKIDHFFQRRKANLEDISSEFTKNLVHLKGLNQLIERIKETITNAFYPQNIDILIYGQDDERYQDEPFLLWLVKNDKIAYRDFIEIDPAYSAIRSDARKYFDSVAAAVVVPLVLNERLLGVINLTRKSNLKRYAAVDFNFLRLLKNQSAIAISNSLVYENIEEQVKRRTEELVEVQKQLIQAGKLATVGTLAGGVAHEINNPLAAILTNAQMLLMSPDELNVEEARESLELIEEATKRCRTIVRKLMTYARKPVESTTISKINLIDVVNKVKAFLDYQFKQENIQIVVVAETSNYPVVGNQNELEQVVTNIVLNAKDATKRVKKSGIIDISLMSNDGWIRLDIKDQGSGISKDHALKIFDPFFTTKDVGKGLGLGLSISQSIIEKYKGSIFFHSQEGEGTIFTINLPEA
ncbi:MAG: GHKL domain-containing protein [Candidatus Omnitrophica bacterium]|nr:GHKL domain-containing protein [Candidatus Omnitrophota bacterium]